MSLLKQLSEHTDITMKQVFEELREIDLLDGDLDGKVSLRALRLRLGLEIGPPERTEEEKSEFWVCTECDHRNVNKLDSCLYCGARKG